jgi:hypothetical protein
MKYVNQLDYPHLLYKTGLKLDYDYYLANKERIDASNFGPLKFEPGMKPLANPQTTVAPAGCGLCCAVMAADQLTPNSTFTLEDALDLSYASHANEGIGTEYDPFAPAFAEKMGYEFKGTNSLEELDAWLATGGVAVAKAGGDRKDGHIGVFTHGWHYILVFAKRTDGKYAILDPSQTPTKYDEPGRKELQESGDLIVDGNILYATGKILAEEVKLFDPGFYMFRRK